MRQLRIFIADPDRDSRLGMQMLLDHEPGMRVVGIAVRSEGLVGQVGAAQPDIVILDWKLVASAPVEFIRNLHSIETHPHIIAIAIRSETKQDAEAAGVDNFVSKDVPPDELLMILLKVKLERNQEQKLEEENL